MATPALPVTTQSPPEGMRKRKITVPLMLMSASSCYEVGISIPSGASRDNLPVAGLPVYMTMNVLVANFLLTGKIPPEPAPEPGG